MFHICCNCKKFNNCEINNIQLIFFEDEYNLININMEKINKLKFIKDYIIFDFGGGISLDIADCDRFEEVNNEN